MCCLFVKFVICLTAASQSRVILVAKVSLGWAKNVVVVVPSVGVVWLPYGSSPPFPPPVTRFGPFVWPDLSGAGELDYSLPEVKFAVTAAHVSSRVVGAGSAPAGVCSN